VSATGLNERFFAGRTDGLTLPINSQELLVATVSKSSLRPPAALLVGLIVFVVEGTLVSRVHPSIRFVVAALGLFLLPLPVILYGIVLDLLFSTHGGRPLQIGTLKNHHTMSTG
jgi:hypothetical protein